MSVKQILKMSDTTIKIGCRVQVPKKNVKGAIAYIGTTGFSTGKWIGINLDEPKGKNNGTVEDKFYFKCNENHGMFVRQTQLILLDANDVPVVDFTEETSTAKTPRSGSSRLSSVKKKAPPVATPPLAKKAEKSSSRLSLASVTSSQSKEDLSGSTASLSTPVVTPSTKRTSSFVEKTPKGKQIPTFSKSMAKFSTPATKSLSKSRSTSRDDVTGSQTGFVETLKPQFTPGQILSPSPALSGSTTGINITGGNSNVSLLQQEVENLREQVKDWQEKYETIIVKRRQDKEKLKELEQARVQVDQLSEFKSRILESKTALQRELQQARKESQDAIDARNAHAEEMTDLADTVEMATLDKEMAEEKAESLAMELQELKDKLEEVTLDYETLKAELEASSTGEGGETRERVSFEFKQLEQQNARLHEALLKSRDYLAQERHNHQKAMKDVDQKKSEIAELSRTKEKLSSRVEQLEEQVVDLQEQVDAAIAAETMASTLAYDKMMLQEEIEKLKEEISDMEAIESANDQLLEEHKELELELNEKLDFTLARLRESQREKEATFENLADRETTIYKFREIVAALQEERSDLLSRLEAVTNRPVSMPESMDYKKVFSETIAQKRAIDVELRQLELEQKKQHVQFLTAFMPESFIGRGGDHDAILTLLLLSRFLVKCEILLSYIPDKFPPVDQIQRSGVVKDDAVIRFSSGARFAFHLHYLRMVLHQYVHGMDTCTSEILLAAGSRFPDLSAQERTVDSFIALVKEDKLDANVLIEPLEKCRQVLEALRSSVFPNLPVHASYSIRDACAALASACEAAATDALALQLLANVEKSGGNSAVTTLTNDMAVNFPKCGQLLRSIKRRIPAKEAALNIPFSIIADLAAHVNIMGCVVRALNELHKQTRQAVLIEGEPDAYIPIEKLEEDFGSAADRCLDSDESGIDAMKVAMNSLTNIVGKLNDMLETHDYDLVAANNQNIPPRPITERAAAVKKEIDQVKVLAKKLEDREIDIKELKKTLKAKGDELSEMTIRKDLLEKKLSNMNKDQGEENVKLKHDLAALKQEFVKKTKEFEETMDHLQTDIDNLEREKKELKEKERLAIKKSDGLSKSGFEISMDKATSPTGILGIAMDCESSLSNIHKMRRLLEQERLSRFQLECEIAAIKIRHATAIPGLMAVKEENKESDNQIEELARKGADLRREVLSTIMPKCIDFSKAKPGVIYDSSKFFLAHAMKRHELSVKVNEFKSEVARVVALSRRGGSVKTPLQIFPTTEMEAALKEVHPVTVATLQIPVPKNSDLSGKTIPLLLDQASITELLKTISSGSA